MSQLLIRHVEPKDHSPIVAVLDEWWGGRPMASMLPKLFFVHFRNTSFIAEFDGKIVGFLIGFISQSVYAEAYIHFVGIHPDYRNLGFGKALYEHFFVTVKQLRCHTVRCVTSPVNRGSIAFHLRMGFAAEASDTIIEGIPIVEDYDGMDEDRVLFVRNLISTVNREDIGFSF